MNTVPTISATWMNTVPQFTGRERENEKIYISFAIYISYLQNNALNFPYKNSWSSFPPPLLLHTTQI